MPHFEWTISIGNLITIVLATIALIGAWKDLNWRIKNLEIWRNEHMIDACARDDILYKLDKVIERMDQRERDRDEFNRQRDQRRGDS